MIKKIFLLKKVLSNMKTAFTPYTLHSKRSTYRILQSIMFTAATGSVKNGTKTINIDPADTMTPIIWSGKCATAISKPKEAKSV